MIDIKVGDVLLQPGQWIIEILKRDKNYFEYTFIWDRWDSHKQLHNHHKHTDIYVLMSAIKIYSAT